MSNKQHISSQKFDENWPDNLKEIWIQNFLKYYENKHNKKLNKEYHKRIAKENTILRKENEERHKLSLDRLGRKKTKFIITEQKKDMEKRKKMYSKY